MAIQLKWPILGVIVPCILIAGLAYGNHYFVFRRNLSYSEQVWFEVAVTMVWVSYLIAIFKSPGSPPPNFMPNSGEWKRWCKKCNNFKPERSHHCKTCNMCVLKMDHHCPWTMNCVGHENLPHFMRFLAWVTAVTGYVCYQHGVRIMHYYNDSDLPMYLVRKSEMYAVIVMAPINLFVCVSVGILFIRCLVNLTKGMSQIEIWEMERIESQFHTERLWLQIRKNYQKLYNKPMPKLSSWKQNFDFLDTDEVEEQEMITEDNMPHKHEEEEVEDPIVPKNFTIDDLIFPYDLGIVKNITSSCGSPWTWILPWGKPKHKGYHFEKNEYMDDEQMALPWPPDGGHMEFTTNDNNIEGIEVNYENISLIKKRLDPRTTMSRNEWSNDLGETLDDFGVDIGAEDENDELQSLRNI